MKTMKYFTVLILVLSLCQISVAEKRVKPKPLEELSDPSSPSYVPYPYPKNRKEIIEDLKYAINRLFVDAQEEYIVGRTPKIKEILIQLLKENSHYKIGKILKVMNKNQRMAHDYTWLILIRGKNGEIAARVAMKAEGLFSTAAPTAKGAEYFRKKYPNSKRGPQFLKTEDDVYISLSEAIGSPVSKNNIKKVERIAFQSDLGAILAPMFVIKMKTGEIYYYSVKTDEIYYIEEKISWKKDKNGIKQSPYELVPFNKKYVPDSINDEILVLKALKKKGR
jgi:hypothetical protein